METTTGISEITDALTAAHLELEEINGLTQTTGDPHPDADEFQYAFEIRGQELDAFIGDLENQRSALLAEDTTASECHDTTASECPKPDDVDGGKVEEHEQKDDIFCAACVASLTLEDFLDVGCGHCYCRECLATMFETSIASVEQRCPPECCDSLTLSIAEDFLDPNLVIRVQRTISERATPLQDRVYCASPACGIFLQRASEASDVNETHKTHGIQCAECGTRTCSQCKSLDHDADCDKDGDQDDSELLETLRQEARDLGYKNCMCGVAIEKELGCNHITCRLCGHQFCYECESKWGDCDCGDGEYE